MSRQKAREIALHLIFELGFSKPETIGETLQNRLDQQLRASIATDVELYAGKLTRGQTDYIMQVVQGVVENKDELDRHIRANLKGWSLSRLSRITISLLRLAIYEMQHVEDVPTGVAINEAVELAKKYDTEEAGSFINGVLGAVARGEGNYDFELEPEIVEEVAEESSETAEEQAQVEMVSFAFDDSDDDEVETIDEMVEMLAEETVVTAEIKQEILVEAAEIVEVEDDELTDEEANNTAE